MMRQQLLRTLVCASLAWPLCACEGHSDVERLGQMIYQQFAGIGDSGSVPQSQVAAIPYATLGVRLGSSGQAMFVLEGRSGSDMQWVGGTQFAIATRDGRILRTTGFVHNLTGFREEEPRPAPAGAAAVHDYEFDLADMNAYGVVVHCSEHEVGREQIVIVGYAHETRHVVEDCAAPELDWNFTDEFWRDVASNYVWRSLQYVHPGLDAITLESLRPVN